VATVWVALGVVYVVWGSTYVAIRVMDETIPPLAGAGLRFLVAGLAMLAFLCARRRELPRLHPRELASAALVGIMLPAGGNGVISYAELHVPAGLAALLVASVPLWLLLIRVLSHDRPSPATLVGLGVGFVGVALLVAREGGKHGVGVLQLLLVLAAALSWAIGSWAAGRLPMPADLQIGSAIEMIAGGIVLAIAAPLCGESWRRLALHGSARSWLAIAYLVLIGSILAFTAYIWLLRHAPISQVSTYAYVNPVVAVALGALVLGEAVTVTTSIGGAIIVLAVWLVIRAEAASAARQT
jgi:drug/metabolite transporter (DMT)-like permease